MKKKHSVEKHGAFFHILALALPLVLSADAAAFTLEEAFIRALADDNPRMRAAQARARVAEADIPVTLSDWLPNVSVRGASNLAWGDEDRSSSNEVRTHENAAELLVQQKIFSLKDYFEVSAARRRAEAGEGEAVQAEQTVLLDVARIYMMVYRMRAIVELRRNNVSVLMRQLSATRDRFEVGETTLTEIAQAEARLAAARASLEEAESELMINSAGYKRLVGERPPPEFEFPTPDQAFSNVEEAEARAMQDSLWIKSRENYWEASEADLDSSLGALAPTLSLEGRLTKQWRDSSSPLIKDRRQASISGQLIVPLYQGGRHYAAIKKARAQRDLARRELDLARRQVIEEVNVAWGNFESADARVDSFNVAVRAASIALAGTREEETVGQRTLLDVLDAEQELLDAEVNRVNAQSDRVVAIYLLKSAAGVLTAHHLGLDLSADDQ